MEELKTALLYIFVLGLLIGGGYLSFKTLDTGPEFIRKTAEQQEHQKQKEEEAEALIKLETSSLPLDEIEMAEKTPLILEEEKVTEIPDEIKIIKSNLEELLAKKINLEPGDKGSAVFQIQKFLNYYDQNLNLKEDQDFGPGTKKAVLKFQKDQGLNPDGGVGPTTISKMIEFLD